MSSEIARVKVDRLEDVAALTERCSQPTIIEGAIDGWPALRRWTWGYLRQSFGARPVQVEVQEAGAAPSDLVNAIFSKASRAFGEVVDHAERSAQTPRMYLAMFPILTVIPELATDFAFVGEPRRGSERDVMFWLGPRGTVSPLHHDEVDNVLAQVRGRKRISFVSPEYSTCLYPQPGAGRHIYSQVDIERPDHDRFPLWKQVQQQTCTIGPGEMLFIPRGHWHHVRSLEPALSLNFWLWR